MRLAAATSPLALRSLTRVMATRLAFVVTSALAPAVQAGGVTLFDLGTLGGSQSEALAINDNGQVVGRANLAGDVSYHAFLSTPGQSMLDLGTLGGSWSTARGINNAGQIVGDASTPNTQLERAFFRPVGGALQDLGTLGNGSRSIAYGVNESGQVTGTSRLNQFDLSNVWYPTAAFISAPNGGALTATGGLPPIAVAQNGFEFNLNFQFEQYTGNAINASGQVAASAWRTTLTANFSDGYVVELNHAPVQFPAAYAVTSALAINDAGRVAGQANGHAFVTNAAGIPVDLGTLGGVSSAAYGINETGQVVGDSNVAGGATHAFLYTGSALVDLTTLTAFTGLRNARDINAYAQIVGQTTDGHAAMLQLNPAWAAGSGNWDDAANWDFGGAGALSGLNPGRPHDVTIDPDTSGVVVTGPATSTQVHGLALGGGGGTATLLLQPGGKLTVGTQLTIGANATLGGNGTVESEVRSAGTLALNGTLQGMLVNSGHVRVDTDRVLSITEGVVENSGLVEVLGKGGSFTGLFTHQRVLNGGTIVLENAIYGGVRDVLAEGLVNEGTLAVREGKSHVFSAIDNQVKGIVTVAAKSEVDFVDEVHNDGKVMVDDAAVARFLGPVSGAGGYSGLGTVDFEGRFHAGNSPAQITLSATTVFGANAVLAMDIAGTDGPGDCASCYAQFVFDGDVMFDGATLEVNLFNEYAPNSGDTFQLFAFNGANKGFLSRMLLPGLAAGLDWDTSELLSAGTLRVTGALLPPPAAVPVPAAAWLLVTALPFLARRRPDGRS